jgi:hypothetical protein
MRSGNSSADERVSGFLLAQVARKGIRFRNVRPPAFGRTPAATRNGVETILGVKRAILCLLEEEDDDDLAI